MPYALLSNPGVQTSKNQKELEKELEALLAMLMQYGVFSKIA